MNEAVQNAYLQWLTGGAAMRRSMYEPTRELSVRTRKALIRWAACNDWTFTPELLAMNPKEQRHALIGTKNFGQTSLREVIEWADRHAYPIHPGIIAELDQ